MHSTCNGQRNVSGAGADVEHGEVVEVTSGDNVLEERFGGADSAEEAIDRTEIGERKFDFAWIEVRSVEDLGLGNAPQLRIKNYELRMRLKPYQKGLNSAFAIHNS